MPQASKPEIVSTEEEDKDMYEGPTDEGSEQPVVEQPAANGAESEQPDATGSGAGGAGSEGSEGAAGEQPEGSESDPTGSDQAPQQQGSGRAAAPAAVPAASLSAEKIQEIANATAAAFEARNRKPEPPAQLTPEQVKALLNPIELTKEDAREAFGIEDASPQQLKALEKFLLKAVKHSTSLSRMVGDERVREVEHRLTPIQQQYEMQKQVEARNYLLSRHPVLADYEALVKVGANQISPTHPDGRSKTRDEVIDEIAIFVTDTMAKSGVDIKTKSNASPAPVAGAVPKMVQRSQPGRSVAGQPKGKANNPDDDIYED